MSPLQLQILLHYRGSATDFREGDFSAPSVREAIDWFKFEGMLAETNGDGYACYRLTQRANVYIDAMLELPFPEQKWVMP